MSKTIDISGFVTNHSEWRDGKELLPVRYLREWMQERLGGMAVYNPDYVAQLELHVAELQQELADTIAHGPYDENERKALAAKERE